MSVRLSMGARPRSRTATGRGWSWALVLLTVAATFLVAWRVGWPPPVESADQQQGRLDVAAPLPLPGAALEQTFAAFHNGLSGVELLLVVWPSQSEERPAALTLRLLEPDGRQLQAASWGLDTLRHNAPLRLSFPPIPDSAGMNYRLRLEGTEGNRATAWAFSLDGYPRGELTAAGQPMPGDLHFRTIYRYTLRAALGDLGRTAWHSAGLLAVLALLVTVPGLAWLPRLPASGSDPAVRLGVALAGSLACIPLGWLWLTELGGRWTGPASWLALAAAGLVLALRRWARWNRGQARGRIRWRPEMAPLAAVLVLGLAVRVVAVRDLVLPAWVDSPQHWLVGRLMADGGQVPAGYRPWLPVDAFWYHFGFHALAASLCQMTGAPMEEILLIGGQALNALAPLSVYAGTVLLTRRRPAGLAAAFFVALLSLFPAYYVTWGRYTQLTGMLMLAPVAGAAFVVLRRQSAARSFGAAAVWLGVVLGGLFLVHARVWVFGLAWLALAAIGHDFWRQAARLLGVLAVSAVAAAPWLIRVVRNLLPAAAAAIGQVAPGGSYNDIPWGYVTHGWERAWLALAAIAWLVALLMFGRQWARRRRPAGASHRTGGSPAAMALLGVWVALLFCVVNADRLGVPTMGLVNNNTLLIGLFLPTAVLIGWLVDGWQRWSVAHPPAGVVGRMVLAAALTWSGLLGLGQMAGMVNAETLLALPDDLAMISWVGHNLPADARLVVNSWLWLPENWAGSDAGYWLWLLTGRETTLPPIGYGFDAGYREQVNTFNQQLAAVESWDAPETLALLRDAGITHLFVGARGGGIRPEQLAVSAHYRLLASNGAAWVFEFDP